ncbi:hypothetical protein ACLOJK_026734 [Asimina triloba]
MDHRIDEGVQPQETPSDLVLVIILSEISHLMVFLELKTKKDAHGVVTSSKAPALPITKEQAIDEMLVNPPEQPDLNDALVVLEQPCIATLIPAVIGRLGSCGSTIDLARTTGCPQIPITSIPIVEGAHFMANNPYQRYPHFRHTPDLESPTVSNESLQDYIIHFNDEDRKVPRLPIKVYMLALIQSICNHELNREFELCPPLTVYELNDVISCYISTEEIEKWRAEQDCLPH